MEDIPESDVVPASDLYLDLLGELPATASQVPVGLVEGMLECLEMWEECTSRMAMQADLATTLPETTPHDAFLEAELDRFQAVNKELL